MKKYKIAVIKGDGTGPEVVHEALKALNHASKLYPFHFQYDDLPFDGTRYLKEGKLLADEELESLKRYDAIFLGAIGHPDVPPGILERGILLKLRFGLDQYINLRPVKLFENVYTPLKDKKPEDINYVVVRENSGDVYTGMGGVCLKGTPYEVATQVMTYSRHQVERCVRYAFEVVKKRNKASHWRGLSEEEKKKGYIGKLTLCGKTNVLTYVYDLWQRALEEVGKDYPMVKTDYVHVDAICIYMLECPERFDVIVTGNMFGDIITDLAAVTQGGMGIAPSGNINPQGVSMFEPIHGTAPQFTGKNAINPLASILAGSMMLAHLGEEEAARHIESAVKHSVKKMKSMQAGKMGLTTSEAGDLVVEIMGSSISE